MSATIEEQWDLHGNALWILACALLGNREVAMDAVASAMVDRAERPPPEASENHLREIALDVYRTSARLVPDTSRSTPALTPSVGRLGELAAGQRTALALCAYGGHTYRDAADALGLHPEVVAALLVSGLRDLLRLGPPPPDALEDPGRLFWRAVQVKKIPAYGFGSK